MLHDKLFIHFYTTPLGKDRLNLEEAIKMDYLNVKAVIQSDKRIACNTEI